MRILEKGSPKETHGIRGTGRNEVGLSIKDLKTGCVWGRWRRGRDGSRGRMKTEGWLNKQKGDAKCQITKVEIRRRLRGSNQGSERFT